MNMISISNDENNKMVNKMFDLSNNHSDTN